MDRKKYKGSQINMHVLQYGDNKALYYEAGSSEIWISAPKKVVINCCINPGFITVVVVLAASHQLQTEKSVLTPERLKKSSQQ